MALRKGRTAGTVIGAIAIGAIGWGGYAAQSTLTLLRQADAALALPPAGHVSNIDAKGDRLMPASYQLASLSPSFARSDSAPASSEPDALVTSSNQNPSPLPETTNTIIAPRSIMAPRQAEVHSVEKPKPPQPPKANGLLDDAQIAGLKGRLRLTADQEGYWPAVEAALREVVRHARKKDASSPPAIDTNSPEVKRLTWAAMPLLFRMREDQKREVRTLARVMGLESVASQI